MSRGVVSAAERVGDLAIEGVEPGAVYLLRSSVGAHMCYEARDLLHVISRYIGGEVRGYERPAGSSEPWRVRLPAHEGHWPEVDRAVATLTGERVVGRDGVEVSP